MRWVYSRPHIRVDRPGTTTATRNTLVATERSLEKWYARRLLGQRVGSGGPKGGSTIGTSDDLARAYEYAASQIKQRGGKETNKRVALFMGEWLDRRISPQSVSNWRGKYIPER